jgi:hypothetical protein
MVPLAAVGGRIVIAVAVLGAVVMLVFLLRMEAREQASRDAESEQKRP